MGAVSIGADIGQRRDPTAIAVVETEERDSGRERSESRTVWGPETRALTGFVVQPVRPRMESEQVTVTLPVLEDHYIVRHLERLPLGTAYPQVATRLQAVVAAVVERTHREPGLYLDATGVGQPVVDLIAAAGVKATLYAAYFTHGDRLTRDRRELRVGKAYLVSRLQALLQSRRIHLPRTAEAEALQRELLDYEIKVDAQANDTYGAFKVGTHDDLVTALGLAVLPPPVRWGLA